MNSLTLTPSNESAPPSGIIDRLRTRTPNFYKKAGGALLSLLAVTTLACGPGDKADSDSGLRSEVPIEAPLAEETATTESIDTPDLPVTTTSHAHNDTEPTSNSTQKTKEAESPEEKPSNEQKFLDSAEKQTIVEKSGFFGLAEFDLKISGEFSTDKSNVKVITIGEGQPFQDIEGIKKMTEKAESIADLNLSFAPEMSLGSDYRTTVPYTIRPSGVETQYVIYAGSIDQVKRAAGQELIAEDAGCISVVNRGISVSILSDQGSRVRDGVPNNIVCDRVETMHRALAFDLDPEFKANLLTKQPVMDNLAYPGLENTFVNNMRVLEELVIRDHGAFGLGRAWSIAESGKNYGQFASMPQEFPTMPQLMADLPDIDSELYAHLSSAA